MYQGHQDQAFGHITYAQHGDDLFILNLFYLLGIRTPSYLDIGAHHPIHISNTALLYNKGCRGVNVEANPHLIGNFIKYRPDDININAAIGLESSVKTLYMYDRTSGRNSTVPGELESVGLQVRETIDVNVMTMRQILEQCPNGAYPDLLSMDIEGMDFDILANEKFTTSKPKVICVEVRRADTDKFRRMMGSNGFHLLVRLQENLIFIDDRYLDQIF